MRKYRDLVKACVSHYSRIVYGCEVAHAGCRRISRIPRIFEYAERCNISGVFCAGFLCVYLSTEKRRHRMVAEQSQNDLISMSCVGELLLIGAPLKANANTTSLPAVSVLVITTVGRPATPRGHRRSLTWGNGTVIFALDLVTRQDTVSKYST